MLKGRRPDSYQPRPTAWVPDDKPKCGLKDRLIPEADEAVLQTARSSIVRYPGRWPDRMTLRQGVGGSVSRSSLFVGPRREHTLQLGSRELPHANPAPFRHSRGPTHRPTDPPTHRVLTSDFRPLTSDLRPPTSCFSAVGIERIGVGCGLTRCKEHG